ncbi:MAG: Ca2+-dependent phosphoinositide-specific phospholipase C [Planctomycetaceae bacterium]
MLNASAAAAAPAEAQAIDCTQPAITEQLGRLGIRHLELDCYRDPNGGLFARPLALTLAAASGRPAALEWAEALAEPGIKVLHSPGFDFRTTVPSLRAALAEVKQWSDTHPRHVPVFLLLELKSDAFAPPTPVPWNERGFEELEATILGVFPRERLLVPDDVRAGAATLREAVRGRGWPPVDDHRGKIVCLLDNEGAVRDTYLATSPALAGRLLFVSVPPDHPAAAFMKRNDPIAAHDEIRALVDEGFLVRTRIDAGLDEPSRGDLGRFRRALDSGAQLLSTDVPEPIERFPGYALTLPPPPGEGGDD